MAGLIHRFHAVESDNRLFDLGREDGTPLWDLCRYTAYVRYYYPESGQKRLSKVRPHPLRDYLLLAGHLVRAVLKLVLHRVENVVITCSRMKDAEGRHFDKSATPLVEHLGRNAIVLEAVSGRRLRYGHVYDFACVFRRLFPRQAPERADYARIRDALVRGFGECRLTLDDVAQIYHNYRSDAVYYGWIFRVLGAKRIFIAEGNPKGSLRAAQVHGVTTYLLQHGGIEFDEIDFSYPASITRADNILFPDYVLTLGDYWCRNMKIPAKKIIPVGNDLFFSRPEVAGDDSVLVISTIVHGELLRELTRETAVLHPQQNFVFKLHPNEYHLAEDYIAYFSACRNVAVMTDRCDVSVLTARSKLVLLIVSAVLYEALNQGKKVAIYKRLNYERQQCVAHLPNVYFVDHARDISPLLRTPAVTTDVTFYKPTDFALLGRVASGCLESEIAEECLS